MASAREIADAVPEIASQRTSLALSTIVTGGIQLALDLRSF